MSTRSKTRASAAKDQGASTMTQIKTKGPATVTATDRKVGEESVRVSATPSLGGKEGLKEKDAAGNTSKPKGKNGAKAKSHSLKTVDCICSKGDDGSPMVLCSGCRIWYHFTCVDISEPEAEEINVYICPTCTQTTRRKPALTWEGDFALEESTDDETTIKDRRQNALKTRKRTRSPQHKMAMDVDGEESDQDQSSEDEYKEEQGRRKASRDRRRGRVVSTESSGSEDTDAPRKPSRFRRSRSPPPSSTTPQSHTAHPRLKRKGAIVSGNSTPAPKRKKSGSTPSSTDDPARKYCFGKLEELFKEVFLRYPHVRGEETKEEDVEMKVDGDDQGPAKIDDLVFKKLEELTEEEKESLLNEAKQFAADLEQSVYDIYSEPDKFGNLHAGGKYKDRFRMLQFNLSKPDRVMIHQRITTGTITPKEISLMSSTDLADEETKQSIKIAEKEALEYSILMRPTVPRAKITHKGLQDIEDVNGDIASAREAERELEREHEEEERRERERLARQRPSTVRQRTMSVSVPPESPTTPHLYQQQHQQSPIPGEQQQQRWGAPPPVPTHAMSPTEGNGSFGTMSAGDLSGEPELNLTDLINIDEDHENEGGGAAYGGPVVASPVDGAFSMPPPSSASSTGSTQMTTGISPFAARPDRPRGMSFDLNSLWNAPEEDGATNRASERSATPPLPSRDEVKAAAAASEAEEDEDAMELESVEADDKDFDMFLEEKEPASAPEADKPAIAPAPIVVEALPKVWSGKVTMPLDSTMPQETGVVARQIGGKYLAADSPLWQTLFPSEMLRIEGRVPVENSVKYLLQMRLNPVKELYAAAFTPLDRASEGDFRIFCNFLISKSRHGLVFPWGSRPKDYHPGRELYMIPLLQTDPLPEFMELMDDLKLPKTRSVDYLVGVWILNKGKLAPLPNHPGAPTPAVSVQQNQNQHQQSTPPVNIPSFSATPPHAAMPPSILPHPTIPGLSIAPAALAAEVASLTPEQIQTLLRTLSATTQLPFPPAPPVTQTPSLPPQPTPPAPALNQPWMNAPPPAAQYSMGFPPPPHNLPPPSTHQGYQQHVQQPQHMHQQPPPLPSHISPPHTQPHSPYDHHEGRDFKAGPHYNRGDRDDRGERGWRGNPAGNRGGDRGGRGRGRGRNDSAGGDFQRKPVDSGWPRRQRTDSQGGGPGW